MNRDLTHFDNRGNAVMVDVSEKDITNRTAIASGKIFVNNEVMKKILNGSIGKGDVFAVARVAGIMGAKKTSELVPMCHAVSITKCSIDFEVNEDKGYIETICIVKCTEKTGVEMEALTGTNIALLTIYDMCKAVDKLMEISEVHLVKKTGGKSGEFIDERIH